MDGYVSCVGSSCENNQSSKQQSASWLHCAFIRRLAGVAGCKSSFVCLREGDAMPVIEASEKKERKNGSRMHQGRYMCIYIATRIPVPPSFFAGDEYWCSRCRSHRTWQGRVVVIETE